MNRTGIVSVSHESKLPEYQTKGEESPLRECSARWEHKQEEVRDLPWAQCPPEMAADFVRAMARELLQNDGDQAHGRAALLTASIMGEHHVQHLDLGVRNPRLGASLDLQARIQACPDQGPQETQFEVAIPAQADDDAALEVLGALDSHASAEGLLFDPIKQTPDTEIARVLAIAEKAIGESGMEALAIAALPLLAWHKMETTNAAQLRISLAEILDGDKPVLPEGMGVVFEARSFGMRMASDARQEATRTVRVRSPR